MTQDEKKKAAAEFALKVVDRDVKIGLGTGTTANFFIKAAAEKVRRERLNTIFVPTSAPTYELAQQLGLNIQNIENAPFLDFTVDGADEIDPQFRMIKGGGGALAPREDRGVIIALRHLHLRSIQRELNSLASSRCLWKFQNLVSIRRPGRSSGR